jgi:antitoxin component of MazEF toxin-antitoxin module
MMEQIVKIDSAGGISLPRDVVDALNLSGEDRLLVTSGPEAIVIRKVSAGTLEERFRGLADRVSRRFAERGVAESDVDEAVSWSRK